MRVEWLSCSVEELLHLTMSFISVLHVDDFIDKSSDKCLIRYLTLKTSTIGSHHHVLSAVCHEHF